MCLKCSQLQTLSGIKGAVCLTVQYGALTHYFPTIPICMIWMVCCNSVPANHQEIRSHAMYALPYRYLSNMAFRLNCPKYYSQLVSGHINVTYSSEYADSFFFLPARHSWILYHMNILLLTHKGIMYFLFMII